MAWPESRPETYDGSLVWDEDAGAWIDVNCSGGSRYQENLVVIGQNDDGEGVIYYG